MVAGFFVSLNSIGAGYELFPLFAFLSASGCSFIIWHLLVTTRHATSINYGIFIGFLIVILSHYFTWYFMTIYYYLCNQISGLCLSSLGEQTMNPIESIYKVIPLTFFSLIIAWITMPLGGFIGAIVIKLQNRQNPN